MVRDGWCVAPDIAVHVLQAVFPDFRLGALYAETFALIN